MGSGLTDSGAGLAASLHLLAAFGIDTPVDLNGRQFVTSSYADTTIQLADATPQVPHRPGLGVGVAEDWLRGHAPT
jgi:muconate cycloisomerase